MIPIPKLALSTLAAALVTATSVYALERASQQQMAQAGFEDEGDPGEPAPAAPEEAEPRRGDGEERRERPARRERGEDGDERPPPPRQETLESEEPPAEQPRRARRDRDRDAEEAPAREAPPAAVPEDVPDETPRLKEDAPPAPPAAVPEDTDAREAQPEPPAERPRRRKADPAPEPDAAEPPAETAPAPKAAEPPGPSPEERPDAQAPEATPDAERPRRRDRAAEPAARDEAPPEVKDLKELKEERKERTEDGGKRVVIEEPDNRVIVKEGDRTIIRADETQRFRRVGGDVRREKRNGLDLSIVVRPGGVEIFTESDERGRPLRRYRRDRDGREVILFDNRDYYRRHRDDSFRGAIVDLPPPRVRIPRHEYIVEYDDASEIDVYEALAAEPIERLERTYSLEEVRYSSSLRDRMRRIDLDVINFDFGSWHVASDQYPALERIAKAMNRVIDRNADEMFLIEGHTDAVGSDEDNLSLSDRRAESVAIILTDEFGVPPENIATQGYGEQYLKIETQDAERQNRRVAVRRITPLLSRGN